MCLPVVNYAEGQTQAEATARVRVLGGWTVVYGATTLTTSVGLEAWSGLTTLSNVTGNLLVNSGHNAISTTDKVLAQAGLQLSTSGTNPKGIVEVIVAAKEA